jgi:hypothetical protein
MLRKNKIRLASFVLSAAIGGWLALDTVAPRSVQAAESTAESNSRLNVDLGQRSLNLVAVSPVLADGVAIGALTFYDDPNTRRPADCLELYNSDGDLVAVAWFDQFGIERTAVDLAVIDRGNHGLGNFVVLVGGQSV